MIARQEIDKCTLARTALAHKCHRAAFAHAQVYVLEHLLPSVVRETYVAEEYFLFELLHLFRSRSFHDGIFRVEYLVDAFHACHALWDIVAGFREVFERLYDTVEYHHIKDKLRRINGRVFSVKDERAAIPENDDDEYSSQKFAHGVRAGLTDAHFIC